VSKAKAKDLTLKAETKVMIYDAKYKALQKLYLVILQAINTK